MSESTESGNVEIGSIYKMNLDQQDDVTPKNGIDF